MSGNFLSSLSFLFLLCGVRAHIHYNSHTSLPPVGNLRDYNDECEQFPDDYYFDRPPLRPPAGALPLCNTERGLFCVPGLGRCGCEVPHTIYRAGRCRARVGAGCLLSDQQLLSCVEGAECIRNGTDRGGKGSSKEGIFRCLCRKGYSPNAEMTACFSLWDDSYRRSSYDYERRRRPYYSSGNEIVLGSIALLGSHVVVNFLHYYYKLCLLN